MKDKIQLQNGVGLPSLLTVAFVVLKLTGHIDWSWPWVLSPVLIPLALGILMFCVAALLYGAIRLFKPKGRF